MLEGEVGTASQQMEASDLKCKEEKHEEEKSLTAGSDEENRCLKKWC